MLLLSLSFISSSAESMREHEALAWACQVSVTRDEKIYFFSVYGKIWNAYGVDDDDLMCERIDPLKTCRIHKTLITLTLLLGWRWCFACCLHWPRRPSAKHMKNSIPPEHRKRQHHKLDRHQFLFHSILSENIPAWKWKSHTKLTVKRRRVLLQKSNEFIIDFIIDKIEKK